MYIEDKILAQFYNIISDNKQEMFDRIASDRTRYVTVLMEHIQKEHNASAVLRTCDCLGIQDVHLFEQSRDYEIQREIAKGASNWLNIYSDNQHASLSERVSNIKANGYRLIATSPHAKKTIHELELDQPIALCFGMETKGLSPEFMSYVDDSINIPMVGFTESLNVSVATAILLHSLRNRLKSSDIDWKLTDEEQTELKINWCSKIVNRGFKVQDEIRNRLLRKE